MKAIGPPPKEAGHAKLQSGLERTGKSQKRLPHEEEFPGAQDKAAAKRVMLKAKAVRSANPIACMPFCSDPLTCAP